MFGLSSIAIKLIAAAVVVALIGGAVWKVTSYMAEHRRLQEENVVLHGVNAENLQALEQITAEHARAVEALETMSARASARAEELNTIREEIANAPDDDDGPVAPVLGRALERLRGEGPGGDEDQDGGDADPAVPEELQ